MFSIGNLISPAVRISAALASLGVSVVLISHALGLLPDRPTLVRQGRESLAGTLALHCAWVANVAEPSQISEPLSATFSEIVRRHADLDSITLRDGDGQPIAQGQRDAGGPVLAAADVLTVPIERNGQPWALLELRFPPLVTPVLGSRVSLDGSFMGLVVLMTGAVFLLSYLQLRRIFAGRTAAGIPDRVRATLDALVEGVLLMDKDQRIAHTNKAFQAAIGRSGDDLEGRRIADLGWRDPHSGSVPAEYPWGEALRTGAAKVGALLRLQTPANGSRTFSINCTPVVADDGSRRGTLATFDDMTEVQERNAQLQELLEAIERSRAELAGSNQRLESEIVQRRQAQEELLDLQSKMAYTARQVGMAETATSVLHNVGNVLNSVNTSASIIADKVRNSRAGGLARVADLLTRQLAGGAGDAAQALDPTKLARYVIEINRHLEGERAGLLLEIQRFEERVDNIKEIIRMQQTVARTVTFREPVLVDHLLAEAVQLCEPHLVRRGARVERDCQAMARISLDRSKLLQVLVNLLTNAADAVSSNPEGDRSIRVSARLEEDRLSMEVRDNGVGIREEDLDRIFGFGFTTKPDGHGFGLHHAAIAVSEMQGSIHVESAGAGCGAAFSVRIPASIAGAEG